MTVVAPFQALTSNAHQRGALNALVKILTYQQIRELRSTIEEVDFHCDIIAKLPLEISQLILQYLPLYQIFRARRVSPKWRQVLLSAYTEELLLQDWYPKCDVDQDLQTPTGLSAKSVASFKAEHIDAYRTGHAFGYARHEWDRSAYNMKSLQLVAYADGVIAWVDKREYFVKLLDFQTGEKWSFMLEARDRPADIAMSSSMVAVLDLARCDLWTFRTGDHYALQFPGARSKIAVSGESLIIVRLTWLNQPICRFEVITWRLRDQKTSSLLLPISHEKLGLLFDYKIMLDHKAESLLLVLHFHAYQRHQSTHFFYIRTSLKGDVLSQGSIETPDSRDYHRFSRSIVPKEANGNAVIYSFVKRQRRVSGEDEVSELMLIGYNSRQDRLEVRMQVITGLCNNADPVYSLFVWKDVAYFLEDRNSCPILRVIDLQESTSTEARMNFSVHTRKFDSRTHDRDKIEPLTLGDETFLINVFAQGFCVWCFDANVRMFNEEIAYREGRKSNRERRFLLKQDRKNGSSDDSFTRKLN